MSRLPRSAAAVIALLAAAPAWAQVYKWVDDKGVVNYSSRPPTNRKAALLDPKSVSVSVYTPDESLSRAVRKTPNASDRALEERIASLERRLEVERSSRQILADAQMRLSERRFEECSRDRRVDCDLGGLDPYYAPYWTTVVVSRPHPHFRPRTPIPHAPRMTPPRPAFAPVRAPRPGVPTA